MDKKSSANVKTGSIFVINNLINTPLWNLIQKELNSSNLEFKDALVSDKSSAYSKVSTFRKSKIAWLSDSYLRQQLFYSVDLYNKQNWNY